MTKDKPENRWINFGKWLRRERLKILDKEGKPISQSEAARRAGISRVQWTRWESAESGIGYASVSLVAKGLGWTTDEQIAEIYQQAGFTSDQPEYTLPPKMRHFMSLPREIQEDIAKIVEREHERQQLLKKKRTAPK